MGLLTILDSRVHRNINVWKRIVVFLVSIARTRVFHVER